MVPAARKNTPAETRMILNTVIIIDILLNPFAHEKF
jgi:hypothetical protein